MLRSVRLRWFGLQLVRRLLVIPETKIFASAFPWLFPGGQGDIKDASEIPVKTGNKDVILLMPGLSRTLFIPSSPTSITRHQNSNIWQVVL
jgi:hypothetical protein